MNVGIFVDGPCISCKVVSHVGSSQYIAQTSIDNVVIQVGPKSPRVDCWLGVSFSLRWRCRWRCYAHQSGMSLIPPQLLAFVPLGIFAVDAQMMSLLGVGGLLRSRRCKGTGASQKSQGNGSLHGDGYGCLVSNKKMNRRRSSFPHKQERERLQSFSPLVGYLHASIYLGVINRSACQCSTCARYLFGFWSSTGEEDGLRKEVS